MLYQVAALIVSRGEYLTNMGDSSEIAYMYQDDVWVVRYKGGLLYSVWNPTTNTLIT